MRQRFLVQCQLRSMLSLDEVTPWPMRFRGLPRNWDTLQRSSTAESSRREPHISVARRTDSTNTSPAVDSALTSVGGARTILSASTSACVPNPSGPAREASCDYRAAPVGSKAYDFAGYSATNFDGG